MAAGRDMMYTSVSQGISITQEGYEAMGKSTGYARSCGKISPLSFKPVSATLEQPAAAARGDDERGRLGSRRPRPCHSPPSPAPCIKLKPRRGERGLAVFNVYAVNGTTNPHRDSSTGTIIGDRHAQKRRFHTLLASTVRDYQEQGYQVVIAGDLNVSRTPIDSYPSLRLGAEHVRNRADFEEKFMEKGLGMVDSFRHIHGQKKKYSYRPPGKPWGTGMDRVDLILCSNNMVASNDLHGDDGAGKEWRLENANILDTVEERGPSDHVPLFVDVSSGGSGK